MKEGPSIFQIMNSVRAKKLSFKYQKCTPSGYKDKGIRKFEFVTKNSVPMSRVD